VIVEEAITRVRRKQLTDGELADPWASEEENDLGSHARLN
jgi:hypothetical protein